MSLVAEATRPETSALNKPRVVPNGLQPQIPDARLMKQRVVRYLFYYVALLMLLTSVRYLTAGHTRQLADLQDQASFLERQSAQLHRDISSLESPARVRAWAVTHNMMPYSSGNFSFVALEPLPEVKILAKPKQKVRVITQWR